LVSAGLGQPAAAQTNTGGLPPRPSPFRFVNDQAQLMAPADAKKLESGLRRYADNTGTQIVVVTVPSLGGRDVADYGRALGTAWGVGQRDKNNGVVVLVSGQDRKMSIQPGSGLRDRITPAVTNRAIGQMSPSFKQGNYFAGLRAGLNTIMLAANPASAPESATGTAPATASAAAGGAPLDDQGRMPVATAPSDPLLTPPTSEPDTGPGMGTVLLIALVVGGIIYLLVRMLRSRKAAAMANNGPQPNANPNGTPNFLPNNPNNPGGAPNFLPNRPNGPAGPSGYGPGQGPANYGAPNQSGMGGGMGMGGMLATGAAAAAGAYLGNRMASGHETSGSHLAGDGTATGNNYGMGTGMGAGAAGAAGTGAAGDYFSSRDGGPADTPAPDYFADDTTSNSGDFFSSDDNSSYDDPNSGDMGGGGFDSTDDNSGSW
jgi:uncharacterized membrane protein YgcG